MICSQCGHDETEHPVTGCNHVTVLKTEDHRTPNRHWRKGTTFRIQQKCMCPRFTTKTSLIAPRKPICPINPSNHDVIITQKGWYCRDCNRYY